MSKRAERRHHARRMKAKARRVYRFIFDLDNGYPQDWEDHWVVRNANDLKKCSCASCCNIRRSVWYSGAGRLTKQELDAELELREPVQGVPDERTGL